MYLYSRDGNNGNDRNHGRDEWNLLLEAVVAAAICGHPLSCMDPFLYSEFMNLRSPEHFDAWPNYEPERERQEKVLEKLDH